MPSINICTTEWDPDTQQDVVQPSLVRTQRCFPTHTEFRDFTTPESLWTYCQELGSEQAKADSEQRKFSESLALPDLDNLNLEIDL